LQSQHVTCPTPDILGVSALVDAINHRNAAGATESTVLGPFHVNHDVMMPLWGNISEGQAGSASFVSGKVLDTEGQPVAGVLMDFWQTDGEKGSTPPNPWKSSFANCFSMLKLVTQTLSPPPGVYDVQLDGEYKMFGRGHFRTDKNGAYGFRHVKPIPYPIPTDGPVGDMLSRMGRHPMRPAHIHAILACEGFRPLTTHIFLKGDPYNHSDTVFGVKESLIVDFVEHPPGPTPDGGVSQEPFFTAEFNFVIARK
jgi:hydroxyquinol 1,2-dioxygenase